MEFALVFLAGCCTGVVLAVGIITVVLGWLPRGTRLARRR